MTDPNDPAFAAPDSSYALGSEGLTKREYFASAALQAIIQNPDWTVDSGASAPIKTWDDAALAAVVAADALIRKLNEKPE